MTYAEQIMPNTIFLNPVFSICPCTRNRDDLIDRTLGRRQPVVLHFLEGSNIGLGAPQGRLGLRQCLRCGCGYKRQKRDRVRTTIRG
jgi:hypothetical protein